MNPIRNSIKALIIQDGAILLTKNRDEQGEFYILPGGGQEIGETMEEALHRECAEEISCAVEIGPLRLIREYIGDRHETGVYSQLHQIEFMFLCQISEGTPCMGQTPDTMQTGVEWIPLADFPSIRVFPARLKEFVKANGSIEGPIYMGDTN